jgi:multidrug efflux pump
MGLPGISLGIEQNSKANTLEVAKQIYATLDRVRPGLPAGMTLAINIDRADSINASLREVVIALGISMSLVLLVIFLFLGNLRATLVPAVTIPISVVATFMFMDVMGYSINVLTLLGLVLAIGLVVDDAIVVLENIYRRVEQGQPPLLAAIDGSREIGFAVIATTLVLIAVFVPISFLPGTIGRLFREFGLTLASAVLLSALVALTLTPVMTSRLFRHEQRRGGLAQQLDRFFHSLSRGYERRLRTLLSRPWLIVGGALALLAVAVLALNSLPREFTPPGDLGFVRIELDAPEGASLEYTEQQMLKAEQILFRETERFGDIRRFIMRIGTGGGTGTTEVNEIRGFILLKDWGDRKRSARDVAASLTSQFKALPGVRASIYAMQGLGSRGFGRPVQVVIGGPDYQTLAGWSDRILDLARQNPGLTGVDTNFKERKPQIDVAVDRDRAAELGVSLESVGRTLETVLGSRVVTTYVDRGREYRVILQGQAQDRVVPSDLQNLYVRSDRSGELVPLSNLVELTETSGAMQLNRFDRMRAITISAGLAPGYTLGQAVPYFQELVRTELPPAARLSFDGEAREYLRTQGHFGASFAFALAIVFLVLAALFESFKQPAVIMTTVPLALIGAITGLAIFRLAGSPMSLNIFSQIAMIMLVGIAAKNGVLIVEFANQLRDQGLERVEAVTRAATIRLRPVLMTSLCTAFGSLPFLLATGAGSEQREPIGVVVFFGTTIAVFLTLFAVPAVYALLAGNHRSPHHLAGLIERLRTAAPPPVSSRADQS